MRSVFSALRRVAPFLFSERGSVSLTRSLSAAGAAGPGTLQPGANRGIAAEGGPSSGHALDRTLLADCALSRSTIAEVSFQHGTVRRTHLRGATLRGWSAAESTWDVVDLEGAIVDELKAPDSRWTLVSLRDAVLTEADLSRASLVGCDLTRAELRGVVARGGSFSGVDLSDAVLRNVDLAGADLGGSVFRGAWFAGVDLDDATVLGADFRDVAGLDAATLASLAGRGALTGGGRVRALWTRLLGGADPAAAQPRIRFAMGTSWALLALLLPALFFGRAILSPVPPEEPPAAPLPAPEPEADPQP